MHQSRRVRRIASVSFFLTTVGLLSFATGEDKQPKLYVVDRSVGKDGLYYCTLSMPKDFPVYSIGLFLKDRQDNKVGEAHLGTIDDGTEKLTIFLLSHELVKRSVIMIDTHPFDDERHKRIKLVVGEQGSIQKRDSKTVTIPIE